MDSPKIVVLLPSAYRAQRLAQCLSSLSDARVTIPFDVYTSVTDKASEEVTKYFGALSLFRFPQEYGHGAVWAWNSLLACAPDYDYYVIAADDLIFGDAWLNKAMASGAPVMGLNDLHTVDDRYATHFILSRDFIIEHLGGVVYPPMYKSWWCDHEVMDIARREKAYRFIPDAIAEHVHYDWGIADFDKTYEEALPNHEVDRQIYEQRRAENFPITWQPILKRGKHELDRITA